MFAVLELGGPNLYDYYVNQEIYSSENKYEIVANIARAAAIALNELHQSKDKYSYIKFKQKILKFKELLFIWILKLKILLLPFKRIRLI